MISSIYKVVVFLLLITFVSVIYILSGTEDYSVNNSEVYVTIEEVKVADPAPVADLETFIPAEPVVEMVEEEVFIDDKITYSESLNDELEFEDTFALMEQEVVEEVKESNIEETVVEAVSEETNISIVLTDISSENIDSVVKYLADNKEIGLAFKSGNLEAMKKAKEAGFDNLIVSVTMEPFNESIAIPELSITTTKSTMENIDVLTTVLDEAYMPIAITNDMGSKVTSKKHVNVMKPIMASIKSKNIAFLDSKSNYYSVAEGVAEEYGVPYASNYVFIDKDTSSQEAVIDALNKLKETATYKNSVIAMGDYSEVVIKALGEWLSEHNTKSLSFSK